MFLKNSVLVNNEGCRFKTPEGNCLLRSKSNPRPCDDTGDEKDCEDALTVIKKRLQAQSTRITATANSA
ncbi:MAG: hypothetical protein M1484_01720 [Patescibacteria group bacterium]|nr:hypothetical protein [Patescibacteria group bacterium]MCL5431798.1 hypothetical protein [Patescibacteria group bacterium]